MFQNIYQRFAGTPPVPVGPPVPAGVWPTEEEADTYAELNENPRFRRIRCDEIEPDYCVTCHGSGVVDTFVGTFGTYACKGPAEVTCEDCNGTGEY